MSDADGKEECQALKTQIDDIEKQVYLFNNKYKSLQTENTTLSTNNRECNIQKDELQTQKDALEEKIKGHADVLDDHKAENKGLQLQLDNFNSQKSAQCDDIVNYTRRLKALNESITATIGDEERSGGKSKKARSKTGKRYKKTQRKFRKKRSLKRK